MDEFGMGGHSVHSPNGAVAREVPHPHAHAPSEETVLVSAGGSSGGSALAVANGLADVALGTDTGGSVRLPAAYCGVVGYKPSYGLLSRYGVVPYANSLDTVGLLARSVGEIRRLVVGEKGLWAESDPLDPTCVQQQHRRAGAGGFKDDNGDGGGCTMDEAKAKALLRTLTFGIPAEYNIEELSPSVRDAWHSAATQLAALGARVVPVSLPTTRHALSAYYVLAPAEASSNLAKYDGVRYGPKQHEVEGIHHHHDGNSGSVLYAAVRGANFGAEVQRRILLGAYTLSSAAMDNYFLQAQRVRRLVRRDFDRVFQRANPLVDAAEQHFDLADMDESVLLEDKRGPPQVDFLLCPTAPTLPPTLDEVQARLQRNPTEAYMNDVFTVPASLAGLPAVSIPRKVTRGDDDDKEKLDRDVMGLQIIGQYWDDTRVLAVADALRVLESEDDLRR